jgi:ABC-type transport system involved in multi-copper enzyme maturation permease subunit
MRSTALHAEWTKFRTLRSTWLILTISVIAAVALGAVATATDARGWDDMSDVQRATYDPTSTSLVGVLFGALVLGALGVRTITAEYATGMIRTTAAATPRRWHILAAKTAIVGTATLVVALLANIAGFLTGQRILSSEQIDVSIREPASVDAILAGTIAVSAFAVIGVGLGAIVRRAAVANILMALVVIGGQLFGSAMPMTAQKYLPFSALQASVTVEPSDDLLTTLPAVVVLAGYALATVLVAMYLIERRDV